MLATFALGLCLIGGPEFDFRTYGPYRTDVPTPESILGYAIGDRHTVYHDQDRVVYGIANAAKDRVVAIPYGKSTEGRPLRVFAISSPENIRNLEQIRQNMHTLAHSRDEKARASAMNSPAIVWINECIHGDETASFESGMELIYTLTASDRPDVAKMRENTVIIVNPVYNPDGHERYVVAYNSIPNGNPENGSYDQSIPSAFFGRSNHYRFDMNRDRISMSQAETRQEVALFRKWNPQVYVDQHGQVETYFFPPVQQSVNVNAGRGRYEQWTDTFGRATGSAFDKNGWTYYIRDQFDFFNVCYLDTHTTLMGAIGMTHETDGGRVMARRRSDNTVLTLRDGIAKHFISALAVIGSASEKREELLKSYAEFKFRALSGEHAGKFKRVVVTSEEPRELLRLAEHLDRSGIESSFAAEDWTQGGTHDYWSDRKGRRGFKRGSLIIDMNQSQGPLAKALLEPAADFEPEFVKRQLAKAKADKDGRRDPELDSFEFYDSTAWALPYAYNLSAWWCESNPTVPTEKIVLSVRRPVRSSVGYSLAYRDRDDVLFAAAALRADLKVSQTTKAVSVGGDTLPAGTYLFLAARNEDGFEEELLELAASHKVELRPMKTSYPDEGRHGPGSESVIQLRQPRIGIVYGSAGSLGAGSLWYLMEQEFRLPYESLSTNALAGNLDRYTCLVLPGGVPPASFKAVQAWVQNGGCLIAADIGSAVGDDKFLKLTSQNAETSLPGALFRAEMDPMSFLSFGYPRQGDGPIPFAVPIDGDQFYKTPKSGAAIALSSDEKVKKLLCGWTWEDTEKSLASVLWLHESRVGRGRIVLFSHDPTYRAQYPGLYKLLLNAMITGPSL